MSYYRRGTPESDCVYVYQFRGYPVAKYHCQVCPLQAPGATWKDDPVLGPWGMFWHLVRHRLAGHIRTLTPAVQMLRERRDE